MSTSDSVLVAGQWRDVQSARVLVAGALHDIALTDVASIYHVVSSITSAAPIVDKINYITATFTATNLDGTGRKLANAIPATMKGRGSGTWLAPKKPYKLKLNNSANLLGMGSSNKNWALLANYYDESFIRTAVAYEMTKRATSRWTPRSVFAELTLNNVYAGLYQVTETVEVDVNRVNIRAMKSTDVSGLALTGPYLLEVDSMSTDPGWVTARNTPIYYSAPAVVGTTQQVNYLTTWFDAFETKILAGDNSLVDIPSLCDWIIAQELFGNTDADWFRSCYFYKDQDTSTVPGKVVFWPIWDFDQTWNNGGNGTDHYLPEPNNARYVTGHTSGGSSDWVHWPSVIYQGSSTVRAAVRSRWDAAWKPALAGMSALINKVAADLAPAISRDRSVWYSGVAIHDISTISSMQTWMSGRIAWLDANL